MKKLLSFCSATILFVACQKNIDTTPATSINGESVSSDALTPLPCHTTSFSTNYSTVAGQVPPFRFTKTLYPDTRVKSINLLSRAFPNHANYKKQAYELIGNFSYTTNRAKFVGTRETWEYYKTTTGGAGRRSLGKKPVTYYFNFDPATGFCLRVGAGGYTYNHSIVELSYLDNSLSTAFLGMGDLPEGYPYDYFYFKNDSRGNVTENFHVYNSRQTIVKYVYDYTRTGGRYNYIPTQYAISFEFSLLEVMQWLPPEKNPRKGVSVQFYPYGNSTFVKQSQVYKNHAYDAKKNLISYTYGDNTLQKDSLVL